MKKPDYEEQSSPPQGRSVISHQHTHTYEIIATDMTIVRWCSECGKAWIIVRYANGGLFDTSWREIKEP